VNRRITSLRQRLILSHLAVVTIGVVVLLVATNRLGSAFIDSHMRSMGSTGSMMSGGVSGSTTEVEAAVRSEYNRALLWAAFISAIVAMAAATFSASRVLRPLDDVRRVTQRLASGSYGERAPIPAETELADLAGDVNALAEALEETEQRRLRLISEVSHELRTPVATLKGYVEGMLEGVFSPDEETLTAAARETSRIERLASDLSTLSRTEEGQIDLRPTQLDLADIAGEVAERLRPQFTDNGVGLEVDRSGSAPITADRDRVAQILTNLIGNALSYTQPGGEVKVSTSTGADASAVRVSDNGRGLTPDQLRLVFERFYRADRAATRGSGIGLTIARGLARLQGGDLTAESPGLGLGSTFELTLPSSQIPPYPVL